MVEALAWGAVAASSLLIGALLGILHRWPTRTIGLVLGFGAGALISAVSFELAQEGVQVGGGAAVGIGLGAGALTYYVCDVEIDRRSSGGDNEGAALALGAFLDGLPEQLVLGLGIALGDGVSAGLLGAIFVSNLPEAIGSATAMGRAGRSRRDVLLLWAGVALLCTVASGVGFAIADTASDTLKGGINGFAAGALVVMLVDSMIPEATRQAGRTTGLVTTLGFAVAAGMSGIS
jgi:ZIP family zinc transporter